MSFTEWLDRWFPKRDAERDLGSEETVAAFEAIQQEVKGEKQWSDSSSPKLDSTSLTAE